MSVRDHRKCEYIGHRDPVHSMKYDEFGMNRKAEPLRPEATERNPMQPTLGEWASLSKNCHFWHPVFMCYICVCIAYALHCSP